MKVVVGLIGIVVLIAVTYLSYYQSTPGELAFTGEQAFNLAMVFLTALVMFLGIVFGCLYRRLAGQVDGVRAWTELRAVLSSASFLAALCVSPFVFFVVYAAVSQRPGDPASFLLAFQNGFFCEAVFRQMFPDKAPAPAPAKG
jgi:heme/copper-type cytochrome/quinol oxidase subunit 1